MQTTVSPSVDAAEVRVSRLTAHILLASIARDAGIDMPDSVSFAVSHGHLTLDFEVLDEMAAWVELLNAGPVKVAASSKYIHHTTDMAGWNGWHLYLKCLVARAQGASVEADVSAALDALIVGTSWISVASGEQVSA